jgi:hypothetical protein
VNKYLSNQGTKNLIKNTSLVHWQKNSLDTNQNESGARFFFLLLLLIVTGSGVDTRENII